MSEPPQRPVRPDVSTRAGMSAFVGADRDLAEPADEDGPAGSLLDVADLRVSFDTSRGTVRAVDGISFALAPGEVLALVGESGAGKSVCAMSLLGLLRGPRVRVEGSARLQGQELIGASEVQLRKIRGARMAIVFQDSHSSLNPVLRVGEQIAEQILAHEPAVGKAQALERAEDLLERVGIAQARVRLRSYPHELSGGMRQRVTIAMALSLGAPVLLADEPTTALDVTVQAQILTQLARLRDEQQLGIVLIAHDLALVAGIADRVAVMRAGQIVEHGPTDDVLRAPRHPYTRTLLAGLAPPARGRPAPVSAAPLLEVEDLRVTFRLPGARRHTRIGRWRMQATPSGASARDLQAPAGRRLVALDGVTLVVREGETLAVVGESGCGKTTLLRAIARLHRPDSGSIRFAGAEVTRARGSKLAELRRSLGMVFQDPHGSLNPRRRVGVTVELALRARGAERSEAVTRALELLELVGLPSAYAARYPHELSGGERQRVGIARALACEPRVVLLDEPVSSLDASLRKGILELLADLQARLNCSYLLVSHDLATVAGMAGRIAVMRAGKVVELGDAQDVLERPQHPYTRELLAARPPALGGVGSARWEPSQTP